MKMTQKLMAMAACAVMTLSTAMSVTASAIDTTEQITSISESANTRLKFGFLRTLETVT